MSLYDDDDLSFSVGEGTVESPDDFQGGGTYVDKEGWFHADCTSVSVENKNDESKLLILKIEFHTLAGCNLNTKQDMKSRSNDVKDQIDRLTSCRVYLESWENKYNSAQEREAANDYAKVELDERGLRNRNAAAWGLGLITDKQLSDTNSKYNFKLAVGRQCVIKVTKAKNSNFFSVAWPSDILPLNHEKVADVPRDMEAMAIAGGGVSSEMLAASGL